MRDENNSDLVYWRDTDADLIVDVGESMVIDAAGNVGRFASLAFDGSGRAVVAYYDLSNGDLKLWHDADANHAASPAEIRLIDGSGIVGRFASLAITPGGIAVAAYYDDSFGDLRLWFDADGDFAQDSGERRTLLSAGNVGQYSTLVVDPAGRGTVLFHDVGAGDLRAWVDANTNWSGDAAEFRTIDSVGTVGRFIAAALRPGGGVAAVYYDDDATGLKLWHDANTDGSAQPGEISAVESANAVGQYPDLQFNPAGRAVAVWRDETHGDLRAWLDFDGDARATAAECATADASTSGGFFGRVVRRPSDGAWIAAHYDAAAGAESLRLAVTSFAAGDCNTNEFDDRCEPDCDTNATPDACDLVAVALDCNTNRTLDACDLSGGSADCNSNRTLDVCDVNVAGFDCDTNRTPDACDRAAGAPDCDSNATIDACDLAGLPPSDCNTDGTADCHGDGDADGVNDPCDLCPDTPAELVVDADGCPVAGACCLYNGDCLEATSPVLCDLLAGAYRGDDSDCVLECRTPGDLNADALIDQADLVLLVEVVLGQQPGLYYEIAADLDFSGAADGDDIVLFVAILLATPK